MGGGGGGMGSEIGNIPGFGCIIAAFRWSVLNSVNLKCGNFSLFS